MLYIAIGVGFIAFFLVGWMLGTVVAIEKATKECNKELIDLEDHLKGEIHDLHKKHREEVKELKAYIENLNVKECFPIEDQYGQTTSFNLNRDDLKDAVSESLDKDLRFFAKAKENTIPVEPLKLPKRKPGRPRKKK